MRSGRSSTAPLFACSAGCGDTGPLRRHYATTPLGYLRRVRLERAHEELASAEHGDGRTVAACWGFGNPGRLAERYQEVCGRPPSRTLRDRPARSARIECGQDGLAQDQ
ncbi:helix-turn-helix domain-containing protein [Nocardia niwae]|uniref:Helix-turn-helix domain-containing protein n=1 Tax=Nocardia niwae TaxID=626084 RepID=A0ABV2X7E5_9NOCA